MVLNDRGGVATLQGHGTLQIKDREPSPSLLPHGFPDQILSRMAWHGSDLRETEQYMYELTVADLKEIGEALNAFKTLGLDGDMVTKDTFPLPTLQPRLEALCDELHQGIGFFLIRGLGPQSYSVPDSTIVFLGIQSYIAELRGRQTGSGDMIVHLVSDNEQSFPALQPGASRPSDGSISFHTDEVGDILAFQDRSTIKHGTRAVLASFYAVYNTLAATRPDVIETLAKPDWLFFYPHYHRRPILFYHDDKLMLNFAVESLLGSTYWRRPVEYLKPTAVQLEALSLLQSVAQAQAIQFHAEPGDLRFINNLAILHRRDVHTFEEGMTERGHLARLCLRNEKRRWKLPVGTEDWGAGLGSSWDEAFDQGEKVERIWNIEPMPDAFFPMRQYGT